ncbi:unnamed protein product [Adineta steineri]|uniref:Uncharacterized protein n=1 Tax=Adineta steineri TaxID=433720 RepID=A0A819QQ65_9BILA|nr:unnamed protein product [Adineta steineri]
MITGFSMVAAGLVLERELNVFKEITEIYILIPALLGSKRNLEVTLASRLSTQVCRIMIFVIVISHKRKISPDNIATSTAASLGDLTTLGILFFLEMINGSNPSCEDFFQGDIEGNTSYLQTPCLANLRGRQGLFLATHCIKLIAYSPEPNSIQYIYRTCSRDEGDDNGITRTSHCGFIKLDWINPNRRLRGCLHICDKDACNQAFNLCFSRWNMIYSLILLRLFFI